MWKLFLEAYKQAKIQRQHEKDLKRFIQIGGVDYIALQHMVNQALAGVEIDVLLPDATRIQIRREDPYMKAQRTHDRELY